MYKVGGTVPVGIFMTSYGANKYPYIEIYSGTGTNTPTTRLGYLNGLPAISNISPSGWGLYTNNGFFSGTIVSTSGQIGGWTLGTNAIYNNTNSLTSTAAGLYLGTAGIRNYKDANTYVNITNGVITAKAVDLTGKITATSGNIAGWRIESTYLANGTATAPAANTLILSPNGTSSSYTVGGQASTGWMITAGTTFGVNKNGGVYATSGKIGGWTIDATKIYSGSHSTWNSTSEDGLYLGNDGIAGGSGGTWYLWKDGSAKIGALTLSAAGVLKVPAANIDGTLTIGQIPDEAKNANIEIGGRNLLRGSQTQDTSLGNQRNSVSETNETWLGCTVFKSSEAWADIGFRFDLQVANRGVVKVGDILTYSIWAKTDDTATRKLWGVWMDAKDNSRHLNGAEIANLTSAWVRYEFQMAVTEAMLATNTVGTNTRFECNTSCTSGKYVYWAAPKLEKGTKATDWTPAPEDQEALTLSSGIEYIAGTQTAATNVWTGVTKETALVAGKTIAYHLPFAGTGTAATLTLTLANGSKTAAIGVKFNSNNSAANNVTTHYGAGSVINMTYDGTYWRVAAGYYDTTGIGYARYRTQNPNNIKAAAACTANHIICGTSSGYRNIAANVSFDLNYALMWCGTDIAANGTGTNNYLTYNGVNVKTSGTVESVTQYSTVYLKGTVDGKTFKIAASNFLTCKVPTSDDGFAYIPLGIAYNTTPNIYFNSSSDVYAFRNGAFQKLDSVAKYITAITDSGIRVHAKSNPTQNYAQIDADGMDVVKDGVSVAQFGSTTRIGKTSASHLVLGSSDIKFLDGNSASLLEIDSSGTFKFGQVESGVPYITMQGTSGTDPYYSDRTRESFIILTGARNRTNNQTIALGSTRKWISGDYYDYAGLRIDITQNGWASASLGSSTTGGTDNGGTIEIKSNSKNTTFYGQFTEAEIQDGELGTIRGVFPTYGVVNWGQSTGTPANSYKDFTVDFDHTYSAAPHVIVGFYSTSTAPTFGGLSCAVNSITTTGCTIRIFNSTSTARSPAVEWIAIG